MDRLRETDLVYNAQTWCDEKGEWLVKVQAEASLCGTKLVWERQGRVTQSCRQGAATDQLCM